MDDDDDVGKAALTRMKSVESMALNLMIHVFGLQAYEL
jgi:hypothetical protein